MSMNTQHMRPAAVLLVATVCLLNFLPATSRAIGPRAATVAGDAVKWSSIPVNVDLESDFDVRGKDVTSLVNAALTMWVDPTESDVSFNLRSLGVAVDDTNVCGFFYDSVACPNTATLSDGTNPLVIDEDGTIVADFFGTSNTFTTLGFASIISFNTASGNAVKGEAVFNAACLHGVEISGCERGPLPTDDLSFTDDDFTSFIVHEIGHFLGLDHQQVNLTEATDSDTSNNDLITTMFPTFIIGNGANFKTPEIDDKAALAQLYPSSGFASSTWKITGTVLDSDGTTQLQCANLVARNVANPRVDAISALSGDFAPAGTADGSFTILGLTPGASYTLDLEAIGSGFTGASGYTPCRGSNGEPSPPSFLSTSSGQSALTSLGTFTGSAGDTVSVVATVGSGIIEGTFTGGGGGSGSSGGGCSLIPVRP